MKHINPHSILLCCLLIVASCSDKTAPLKNDTELKQPSVSNNMPSEVATEVFDKAPITKKNATEIGDLEEDCHGKRGVSQMLKEVEASILKIGDKYVISTNNGNSRYNPCDLPKKLMKDGILVRFSGDVLQIRPGERLMATPFRLKNIVERER